VSDLRFLSICSGIEAFSVAAQGLPYEPVGFCEIDPHASALLAYRYPDVPNFGDFTAADFSRIGRVDVLAGGTPCQAFSVAGSRLSLADARGNLTLAFTVLAHELVGSHGLQVAFWENVIGVLNTPDNAFGCFLGALVGHDRAIDAPRGGKWADVGMVAGPRARAAWRVFNAQHFGLAQRRRRVFLVADFGGRADPAEILFEFQSLHGDFAPGREAREDIAGTLSARTQGGGGLGTDFECDGGLVAAFDARQTDVCVYGDITGPLDTKFPGASIADPSATWAVRRLTPIECERLQGFDDNYTLISENTPDGHRYKQLGNSWAVPNVRWILKRIANRLGSAGIMEAAE